MQPGFIIFDLDGTLIDTRGDIARAVNAGLTACRLPTADEAVIVSFVGDGVGRLVDRTVAAVGGDPARAPAVAEALMAAYRERPVVTSAPYPGAERLLALLTPRLPLGVASNKSTDLCRRIFEHFGWTRHFYAIQGGDWGGPRKPDPAVLQHLTQLTGKPASAGVMVGDSVVDIQAGRSAGLRTVAALFGYRPVPELRAAAPDATIDALDQLSAVLESLEAL